jgi:uracil-DNA glycosylase
MDKIDPRIEPTWKEKLAEEFRADYFRDLKKFLLEEKRQHVIYPPGDKIFNAFDKTPFHRVKVVILGQDPYHGPGQAHGLCFSVPHGIKKPPSLVNIFKELQADLNLPVPNHGNLELWAAQGVFLLNATLTVRADQAGSHQGKGWERFTDAVIQKISNEREHVVFLLWGRYAQAKKILINENKHCVLLSAHPSPLSAYNGFFGCRHFSKTNTWLQTNGIEPVNWNPDR